MSTHDEVVQQLRGVLARGVVQTVDDSGDVQTAQLYTGDDVGRSSVEVHQPYGFASNPPDAQPLALVLAIGGDQGHQMSLQLWSAYRFGNLPKGEAVLWHAGGSRLHLKNGGTIDLLAAALLALASQTMTLNASETIALTAQTMMTISAEGGITISGPVSFANDVTFQGNVTITGNLHVGGIVTGTGATRGAL
jgi:phage baseplate assembly protein V